MEKWLKTDLALAFCALLGGATFVVVKNALDHAFVIIFLAVRFSLAALPWRGTIGLSADSNGGRSLRRAPRFKPLACCTPLLQSRDS